VISSVTNCKNLAIYDKWTQSRTQKSRDYVLKLYIVYIVERQIKLQLMSNKLSFLTLVT